ncbi:MAG: 3-dehydroquinate synthase [Rhizomicrobium sp.]
MSERIDIALAQRSYAVHVGSGLLAGTGALIAPFARRPVAVVTDRHVAALHLDRFLARLRAAGIAAQAVVIEPGEEIKSFRGLESLSDALLATGLDRGGLVVAFGGGVVGDLAGFAAGVLKRGVDWIQVPTTLLAQVDSSVGGKTGINTRQGKNLVGLFHQPVLVIADTDLLATLPERERRAGYAEVVKYGVLGDPEFFAWLEAHGARALHGDPAALGPMIARSCRIKAEFVSRDERETGDRALLNLGHTFGHALEAATGYSERLLHGEAVAIGMVMALRLSVRLGHAPPEDARRLERHLASVMLPTRVRDIPGQPPDVDQLLALMGHDKKAKGGRLAFVLVHGMGHAFLTQDVPDDEVRALLQS